MNGNGLRALLSRILTTIPVLFGVVLVTFILIRSLPGDPAVQFASGPNAGAAEIEAVRNQLGLNRSLPEQFWRYLVELGSGNFGNSMLTGQPVLSDFKQRLPATLELAIFAFLLGVGIAIPLGILAAVKRDGWVDQTCRVLSSTSAAMPGFFFGLILIYVFYFLAGIAPEPIGRLPGWALPPPEVTGFMTIDSLLAGDHELFWAALGKMVLPAASMAIFAIAPLLRMMRGSMIDALDSDYVTASRAFGLSCSKVLLRYALPNALLPVFATMGMVLSTMLGANIMIEKLFAWPGIGAYSINALIGLDYAPVQAFVLIVAIMFVIMTFLIDLVSSAVDPRYGKA